VQTTHTDEATKLSKNSKALLDAHGLAWANTRILINLIKGDTEVKNV
jgi:hypothetical protein